jgi:hypothetical protein
MYCAVNSQTPKIGNLLYSNFELFSGFFLDTTHLEYTVIEYFFFRNCLCERIYIPVDTQKMKQLKEIYHPLKMFFTHDVYAYK